MIQIARRSITMPSKSKRKTRSSGNTQQTPEKATKQLKMSNYISTTETQVRAAHEAQAQVHEAHDTFHQDAQDTNQNPDTQWNNETMETMETTPTSATADSSRSRSSSSSSSSRISLKTCDTSDTCTLTDIHNKLCKLEGDIGDILKSLAFTEEKLEEKVKTIDKLEEENGMLKNELAVMRRQNNTLHSSIVKQEDYSRRENILISGIKETKDENCFDIVVDIFEQIGVGRVFIQNCHRVGPQKQPADPNSPSNHCRNIVVRLLHYPDKLRILKLRQNLPRGIYINEDYSAETSRRVMVMRNVHKEAKKSDKNSKLIKDKVIYKNKQYTLENVNTMGINLTKLGEKTDQQHLAFAGRFSQLSSLAPCPIEKDGIQFNSAEQLYQYEKCLDHDNLDAAAAVMSATEPEDVLAVGSRIKVKTDWINTKGVAIMEAGLKAKFKSERMKNKLLSTGSKVLLCATRDPVWGIQEAFTSSSVLQPDTHRGKNLLGNMLMKIREGLTQ